MRSGRMTRRLVATAGMGAIIAMGVLSACAKEQKAPEPTTPTTPATTSPAASPPPPPATPAPPPPAPTEKSINPTGGNLFSPSVKAPGPPTPAPGNEPGNK
ncbi:pyruvate/2-oxoglutarate dehydrogenase complex dihydrolipoamide acyltransferase (E2) component [Mycobacterium sp. URHB0021]